jgi:hypothetical protein
MPLHCRSHPDTALNDDGAPDGTSIYPSGPAYLTIGRFSGDPDRRDHGLMLHAGAKTDDGFMVVNLWRPRTAPGRRPWT